MLRLSPDMPLMRWNFMLVSAAFGWHDEDVLPIGRGVAEWTSFPIGYAASVARRSLISLLIFSTAYKANTSPHTTTLSMAGVLPESAGGMRIIPKCNPNTII